MPRVEIYTKTWCPFSVRAKELLDRKGVHYREIDVTVPQIFIDDHHIGGSDELRAADESGHLDRLLSGETDKAA